jgi:hypothetical protein
MTPEHSTASRACTFPAITLLGLAVLALTSCSSTPPPANPGQPFSASVYDNNAAGFNGEIVTDAISTTATVVSVDRAKRLVVLKRTDGSNVTYKALPKAFAFDDIKAGDAVKVSVAEELAVFLGKNSVPASASTNAAKLRVKLPDGTQAVASEVGTVSFTARITAIDDWLDTVTLQLPDGTSKTIKVSEAVNLADVSVGDVVSVQSSEAAVVMLEKPPVLKAN